MDRARGERWRRRPLLAAGVRTLVLGGPAAAGFAVTWFISGYLPPAHGSGELAGFWFVAFAVSSGVVYLTHVAMRRLMPLAVLLTLTLAFPDEAPSRLRVARTAMNTATLRERVARAREHGVDDEPTRAAEQILALVAAVESHDRGTRGHSERVRVYTDLLADELGLTQFARDRLRWSSLLHDVGKLSVPADILNKPGSLDDEEWDRIRAHPDEGARLTQPLRSWLGEWAMAIEQHHERWDGRGYPRGLQGHEISLAGRIVAVTDAFETMTAARPYRKPRTAAKARRELVRCAGTDFDPAIVRAFVGISIARLGLLTGPLSWLAQTPILRGLEVAAATAGRTAAGAAAVGGALAIGVAPAPASDREPPPRKPVIEREQPRRDVTVVADIEEDLAPRVRDDTVGASPWPSPSPWPSTSFRPSPSPDPAPSDSPTPEPEPSVSADPGGGGGGGGGNPPGPRPPDILPDPRQPRNVE